MFFGLGATVPTLFITRTNLEFLLFITPTNQSGTHIFCEF